MLANQLVAINKNLYEISEQNLALAAADLQLADDSLQLSIKNSTLYFVVPMVHQAVPSFLWQAPVRLLSKQSPCHNCLRVGLLLPDC